MHQSRKTHNAHNETQKRLRSAAGVAYWRIAPVRKEHGDKEFYVEKGSSQKDFKKISSKCFRKSKDASKAKHVNKKELGHIVNPID